MSRSTETKPPANSTPTKRQRGGRNGCQPLYSRELENEICTRLSEGETLNAICRSPGMPTPSAVRQWVLADRPAGIAVRYARARERGYEAMADALFDIADDRSCLGKPDASAAVQQQRLATDVRRWYLSKVLPHRFGDRVEVVGNADQPLVTRIELVPVAPRPIVDVTPQKLEPPEEDLD